MVWWTPSFGSTTTEIIAGITPTRTSLKLNVAPSTAMAMSPAATSPTPPPKAWPFAATITGFGPSQIRFRISTNGIALPRARRHRGAAALQIGAGAERRARCR